VEKHERACLDLLIHATDWGAIFPKASLQQLLLQP